jgi:hypothetical protein
MKKTVLMLVVILVVFTAMSALATTKAHGSDGKTRIYYFVHPYVTYHTYTYAPVVYSGVYYPRVYVVPAYHVYPVYRAYPVYTYSYWYNRYANWNHR